ncbi:hypothetical protein QBC38DRAFT_372940, partial [Podospora fimiseda]
SHIVSSNTSSVLPVEVQVLREIATADTALDEISNFPGSIRHYIFCRGRPDAVTGRLRRGLLFFIYQTGRHGPQNGFRLCLVHRGFYMASSSETTSTRAEGEVFEDDIDRIGRDIPQGHMEVVILGDSPPAAVDDEEPGIE